jgi:hypothetical protein
MWSKWRWTLGSIAWVAWTMNAHFIFLDLESHKIRKGRDWFEVSYIRVEDMVV